MQFNKYSLNVYSRDSKDNVKSSSRASETASNSCLFFLFPYGLQKGTQRNVERVWYVK